MSNSGKQSSNNSGDNVFRTIPVGADEPSLFSQFLDAHDFASESRRAFSNDLRKFARWFSGANKEPFKVGRVTTRDISDFKGYLRREMNQAVSTVNRCLVSLRRFFGWLVSENQLASNPAKPVKELRMQALAPKGMERKDVRRLLREIELRQDVRANAIFHLFLYSGCRVSDLVGLELSDLILNERSGSAVFRNGKGGKQRTVPLPLACRCALIGYMETRPPVQSEKVFVGERGALTPRGVRGLCDKYSVLISLKIYPHLLRHTMAHKFLEDNPGDLVSLAQLLGHSNLDTTRRYVERGEEELGEAMDRLSF